MIFADRDAPDGPAEVRLGFAEVEVRERPILGPAGEPQVRSFPTRNYYLGWSNWGNVEDTPVETGPTTKPGPR